ncbi:hypothetical protein HPB52_025282 [Rhipicephalus sanguineus]|uniref:Uncharacterized protein n=1 Tax=Rhipicephalus sanguineus TaxID=34632 RepID=A0A9D4TD67_RHISA|nr:hypothetical protein HPB52_025282 [Rhipicephalus sanguineus]
MTVFTRHGDGEEKFFSEEQRTSLLDLLSRHRSVVENKRTDAASMSRKGSGTPPPSQLTDELQHVGDNVSHMAVRLPNPCDSNRNRHDAVPGESGSSKAQCAPAVTALLSETQDRPVEESTCCDNNYDKPTDLWSWDDNSSPLADTSTGTALAHGQAPDPLESPSEAAAAPPTTPASAAAASTSNAAAPASKRSTSRIQRQTAVSTQLGARLDAIKEELGEHGESVVIIAATVEASQALSKTYRPWCIVNGDGNVVSAHCTCMAG